MAVTRAQCPFAGYVGGHLEEIRLRVLNQLRVVVSQETQKDLLGDVIEVAGIQRPTSTQKLSQWGTPAPEPGKPVRQPFIRCAGTHVCLDDVTGPSGPHPEFHFPLTRGAVSLQTKVSDILIEALGLQLAVELRRYYAGIEESFASNGLDAWRLRLIDERIEEGGPTPSISDLASLCSISVRQLARGFRASRDISLGRYLANRRMEQAKAGLATGCAVKAVAYSLGYSSVASFCHAFRKTVGITPGQYKSQISVRG